MNYVSIILLIICVGGVAFLLCFLLALCRDKSGTIGSSEPYVERENAGDLNKLKAAAREGRFGDRHLVITKENKVRGS